MNLDRFLKSRANDWSELEAIIKDARGNPARLNQQQILRLGVLYRSAASDLALARREFTGATGTLRLAGLVGAAHSLIYSKTTREDTIGEFLRLRMWQRIRENSSCLVLSIGFLALGLILGALWGLADPASAIGLLPQGFHATAHPGKGGLLGISIAARSGVAMSIWINNVEVAFAALAGGFTLGILTIYLLAYNAALIGVLGALEWRANGFGQFLSLVLPHGLLELSCIALSGAAGFGVARALIDPGKLSRADALANRVPLIGTTIMAVIIFLAVAGLTEGFITPSDLPTYGALGVGLGLAVPFWTMLVWKGKLPKSQDASEGDYRETYLVKPI